MMAEGEGVDPSVRLRTQDFSRPPRSTRPALRRRTAVSAAAKQDKAAVLSLELFESLYDESATEGHQASSNNGIEPTPGSAQYSAPFRGDEREKLVVEQIN